MIKLEIVRPVESVYFCRRMFYKGRTYISRQSRDANQILVWLPEFSEWVEVANFRYALCWKMLKQYNERFSVEETVYVKNWAELKQFVASCDNWKV